MLPYTSHCELTSAFCYGLQILIHANGEEQGVIILPEVPIRILLISQTNLYVWFQNAFVEYSVLVRTSIRQINYKIRPCAARVAPNGAMTDDGLVVGDVLTTIPCPEDFIMFADNSKYCITYEQCNWHKVGNHEITHIGPRAIVIDSNKNVILKINGSIKVDDVHSIRETVLGHVRIDFKSGGYFVSQMRM